MKGLTFQGVHDVRVEEVPDPGIEAPTDAIVRVTMAGICGSDLHIFNAGEAFGFPVGSRLGHEFIGTVEEVGPEVRGVAAGDRVMSSCMVACGECTWCREGLESSCVRWSLFGWAPRVWQHGGAVQGGQAELVRVPLAGSHPAPHARGPRRPRPRGDPAAHRRRHVQPAGTASPRPARRPASRSW